MCWLDVGLAGQDEILLMNYWYSLQERIFHQQTSRFTLALHGTLGSGEEMEDQHSHHISHPARVSKIALTQQYSNYSVVFLRYVL